MIRQDTGYKLAQKNYMIYQNAMNYGHWEYESTAKRNDLYYQAVQWTDDELENLGDKPDLTINLVFKVINTIRGLYAGSKYSIRAVPRELEIDAEKASATNSVLDYIFTKSGYKYEEASAFDDALIQNRGYIDTDIEFDDNFLGHVTSESVDPMDIIPDPNAKSYDPEKWNYYLKLSWASLESIEDSYGRKVRKRVEKWINGYTSQDWGYDRGQIRSKFAGDTYEYITSFYNTGNEDNPHYMVRIIELNEKLLKNRFVLVDPIDGTQKVLPLDTKEAEAEAMAEEEDLEFIKKQVPTIRQVITAGEEVTLYEGYSSRPFYTITPIFPFFRRGITPGLIDQMISPQDLLNKTLSQGLHVLNQTANGGWMWEEGSITNMDGEDLEEIGGGTNVNIEVKRGASFKPEKIQPNDVPRGLDNLTKMSLGLIEQITGIKDIDMTQMNSEPAVKDAMKKSALPFASIFENLERSRVIIGNKVLWYMQNYYKEPRRLRIKTNDEYGQETDSYYDINVSDKTDITNGSYDIDIESINSYESDDNDQFRSLLEMMDREIPVPSSMLVKYSNLTDKETLIKAIKEKEEPSSEERQIIQRNQQLELGMKEAELRKLTSDTAHRNAESSRMATQTAEILTQDPLMAIMAQEILDGNWNMNKKQAEQEQAEEILKQQQMQGIQPQ